MILACYSWKKKLFVVSKQGIKPVVLLPLDTPQWLWEQGQRKLLEAALLL